MKTYLIISSFFLVLSSCRTPMAEKEVDFLTTCQGKTLDDLERNLILNGYLLKLKTKQSLRTEFKPLGGHRSQAIIAVRTKDHQVKFRVHYRKKTYEKIELEKNLSTLATSRKDPSSAQQSSKYFPVIREYEKPYYKEEKDSCLQLKKRVCGS